MSEARKRIGCVIVAHGDVAACLLDGVQRILGTQDGCRAVSNAGLGLAELVETVEEAIDDLAKTRDVVLFTDMPGGSCYHVCQEIVTARAGIQAMSGVNLMMLLEFFVKRDHHSMSELLRLVEERGRGAISLL